MAPIRSASGSTASPPSSTTQRGEVTAVRDVDLEVAPGEFLTLLGPSGCGKTTTLRMIAGFQEPSAGRIFIGEQRRHARRRPTSATSASCSRTTRCFRTCRCSRTSPTACGCRRRPADEIAARRRARCWSWSGSRGYERQHAARAVRRPAAARRAGARHRHPAARAAVRRAAVESRREAARRRCAARSAACSRRCASPRSTSRTTRKRRWRSPTASP